MLLGSVTVGNISSFMFVSSQCFILGASFLKKIYFISCCKALFQSGGILDIEAGVSRTKTDPRMCQCWTSSNDLSQIREGMQHHQHLQTSDSFSAILAYFQIMRREFCFFCVEPLQPTKGSWLVPLHCGPGWYVFRSPLC